MFLQRAISRLRAAHGLAFAIAAGHKPHPGDLEAAGLEGVSSDLFEGSGQVKMTVGIDTPEATPMPAPCGVAVAWNGSPARESV
jgi:hypothetical protein